MGCNEPGVAGQNVHLCFCRVLKIAWLHYTGQYEDLNSVLTSDLTGSLKPQTPRSGSRPWRARKIREWVTLDLITSYTFNLPPPASGAVPGLAKDSGKSVQMKDDKEKDVLLISAISTNPCGWHAWLNNTTVTLGMKTCSIRFRLLWLEPRK